MNLNPKQDLKAVIVATEGTATFHVKTLATNSCYKATPRGKLRRKKKAYYLRIGDLVTIKLLENNNRTASITEKLFNEVVPNPEKYTEQNHDCTLKADL